MLDKLLAKEELRKYQLLKGLERSEYFSLTKKELIDQLEISNYVLKNTVEQLSVDLERYGLAKDIKVFMNEPFVQLEITGTASSETLLEKYVVESICFRMIAGAGLEKFKSLNEFSEKELISYPIAYSNYKRLNKYLSSFKLKIDKKFRLVGESEKNVRLFLTELFSRIYKNDFCIFNKGSRSGAEEKISTLSMPNFTIHEKISIQQYLYITNLRIKQKKYVELQEKDVLSSDDIKKESQTLFFKQVPIECREAEVIAFLRYYYSRTEELATKLNLAEGEQVFNWTSHLFEELSQYFPKINGQSRSKDTFFKRGCFLHFQLLETSQAYEDIQPEINISYFQQNFPNILNFCREYVNKLQESAPELFSKRKQVFFNYLFLILNSFPKSVLFETVRIYIDFSFGSFYNQFMVENLAFFHLAGAEVIEDIETADILLTDSRDIGKEYDKDTIVWLAPPRPLDWANLGQKIIQIRLKKSEDES